MNSSSRLHYERSPIGFCDTCLLDFPNGTYWIPCIIQSFKLYWIDQTNMKNLTL